MRSLYLTGYPTKLSVGPDGLRITNGKETTATAPPYFPYDQVVIQRADGYVSLRALRILMEQKVSIALLDYRGMLRGHFVPYARRGDGGLWLHQLRAATDPRQRFTIAKKIVAEAYARRGASFDCSKARTVAELVNLEARAGDSHWVRWAERLSERWP